MKTSHIKQDLLRRIIQKLTADLALFFNAAKTAHEASINVENQPDNKYDTLALEASYVAQGQANRAQELRRSIETYKQLVLPLASDVVQLACLVTLESDSGEQKRVFIGPLEGGLKVATEMGDIMVITPASPLGKALIGQNLDDEVSINSGASRICYQITEIL